MRYGIFAFFRAIMHVISPLVLIWSLNTLFNLGIPFSFKTWLAGLLLIYVIRYHLRPGKSYDPLFMDEDEEEEEEEEEIVAPETKAERLQQLQEDLVRFKKEQEQLKSRRKKERD
jgi:hypothetical protein